MLTTLSRGLTAACAILAAQSAHAASLSPFLFTDQTADAVMLAFDRDGDGDANDAGETTVFFDGSNASGLASPTTNAFSLAQAADGAVLVGDGSADSVFRLRDLNGDGDANDAGEAGLWFSAADNASGLTLNTPNGLAEGADGAIYLVEADTSGSPTGDFVYRTVDLNGDGDANDAGEATAWLDLSALNASSSPFEIQFDGDVAYITDTAGATDDVVYRAQDLNGDGDANDAGEVVRFITEDGTLGASVDFAMDVGGGSVWTWDWLPGDDDELALYRYTDLDGSGVIDAFAEVALAWDTTLLDTAYTFLAGFAMDYNDLTGEVLITSNDGDPAGDWIIRLFDLDGDGLFLSPDEHALALVASEGGAIIRPRDVIAYAGATPAPVPVPAPLGLLAGGLGLLAALRRRR
jgi:hypothetical protein